MPEPRPTCPECGSVIDPRNHVTLGQREEDVIPDLFETSIFRPKRLDGIYCCGDCVLDALDRGYPEHRGPYIDEDE